MIFPLRRVALLLALLSGAAYALPAAAQTTTITASHERMAGAPITTGTVSIVGVNGQGVAIPFVDGAGNANGPLAFACQIANGAVTGMIQPDGTVSGTCAVPDSLLSTPQVSYAIQVCDNSVGLSTSGRCFNEGPVAGISGASWALDRYAPAASYPIAQAFTVTSGIGAAPPNCFPPAFDVRVNSGVASLSACYGGVNYPIAGGGGGAAAATATLPGTVLLAQGQSSNILSKVASTGSYGDLLNLPTIPSAPLFQVSGIPTSVQGTVNFKPGTGMTITSDAQGGITFASSAPGGGTSLALTTTGTSGAATYSGGVLNIPQYAGGAASAVGLPGQVEIAGASGAFAASLPVQEFSRVPRLDMFSWLQALHNCANQVVYASLLSDSRGVVWTGDGSGEGPSTYQARYLDLFTTAVDAGCTWHGTGVNPFNKFLVPGSPNPDDEYYTAISGTWGYDSSFGPAQTAPATNTTYAPLMTASAGMSFTYTTSAVAKAVDTVRAYCAVGPSFGTWNFNVESLGGASVATFSCGGNSSSEAASAQVSSTFSAQQVNVLASCSATPCKLMGMEASVGTTGFEMNNLGEASAVAELYNSSTAFAFIDMMPPVSLLITDFGTNDPGAGFTPSQYAGALTTIVSHFQAQSTKPSAIVTFPPIWTSATVSTQQSFAAAAYGVAEALGTAWDNRLDSWGTTFFPSLFGPDGVHPNALGSRLEADDLLGTAMDPASLAATSGSGAGAQQASSTTNTTGSGIISSSTGNASQSVTSTANGFDAATENFSAYGGHSFSFGAFSNNSSTPTGIAGAVGFLDNTLSKAVWTYTPAGDICFLTATNNNIANCSDALFRLNHDGTTFGFSATPTAVVYGTPTVASINSSGTSFPASWPATDAGFTLLVQPSAAIAANAAIATVTFGKHWLAAGSPGQVACTVSEVAAGANPPYILAQTAASSSATGSVQLASTAPIASGAVLIYTFQCGAGQTEN